jgi:hypothetical protein
MRSPTSYAQTHCNLGQIIVGAKLGAEILQRTPMPHAENCRPEVDSIQMAGL